MSKSRCGESMQKTFYERSIRKLTKIGKRNAILRILMIILIVVIIGIHNSIVFFAQNGRRFSVIACAVLYFFVNASFIDLNTNPQPTEEIYETTEFLSDAIALSNTISEEVVLDDNDIIDELGGEDFLYDDEETDSFSADEILEENIEYIAGENGKTAKEEEEETSLLSKYENYVFDADDWRYVLINKQHPIPDDYEFTLGTIKGTMQCDERIIEALVNMLQAAKEDGVNLAVCSPYRDLKLQQVLFERKINNYMAKGYSYLDAYKITSQAVTVPGASEHQIGLAIDFLSDVYRTLDEEFENCDAGIWLKEHSYEYGFILRYPKGKEYITGISYEPWHFRYVGVEAATVITLNDLTLEEFTDEYLQ